MAPLYVGNVFDEAGGICCFNHALLKDITYGHTPIKYLRSVKQPISFMHFKLRNAYLQKSILRNQYIEWDIPNHLMERHRRIYNHATKRKAVSMDNFFSE